MEKIVLKTVSKKSKKPDLSETWDFYQNMKKLENEANSIMVLSELQTLIWELKSIWIRFRY